MDKHEIELMKQMLATMNIFFKVSDDKFVQVVSITRRDDEEEFGECANLRNGTYAHLPDCELSYFVIIKDFKDYVDIYAKIMNG